MRPHEAEERRDEAPLPTETSDPGAEPAGDDDVDVERELDEAVDRPMEEESAEEPTDVGSSSSSVSEYPDEEAPKEKDEEDPLTQARRERDEYLALAQRAQADFDNYRKRAARDSAEAGRRAKGNLVRELLPVVDNLERALESAGEGEQHLAEGVRLVHSELVGLLARTGVESFDPRGEAFDPTLHEAISTQPVDGQEQGQVLEVVQKGYRLNGGVLRPARVVVSA